VFILLCIITLLLNGCSLVGLGIGSLVDSNFKESISGIHPLYYKLNSYKLGKWIGIIKKDSTFISGKYNGIKNLPPEFYNRYYSASREMMSYELSLPAIGDSIVIYSWVEKKNIRCIFLGFDYGSIMLKYPGKEEPKKENLLTIRDVTDNFGNIINSNILNERISEGRIPILSGIAIEYENDNILVAINDIDQIKYKTNSGKIAGLIIGGIIDALLIVVFRQFGNMSSLGGLGGDF